MLSMKLTALMIPTTQSEVTNPFIQGLSNSFIPEPLTNKSQDVITPTTDCDKNLIFGDNS